VLWAEYLASHYDPDQFDSYDAQGWYVLVGYDITKKLQALVKYETFDPDTDVSGDSTDTWTFGLSYAFKGNNLKVYLNYLLLDVPTSRSSSTKSSPAFRHPSDHRACRIRIV
jgi:phosphate-selective porin OprO and OprP